MLKSSVNQLQKGVRINRRLLYNLVLPKLTVSYMTTQTSVTAIVSSLIKAHVLKVAHRVLFHTYLG